MTTSEFDNIDSLVDTYINAGAVNYYSTSDETISIEKYLIEYEEKNDRVEAEKSILTIISKLYPDKVIVPEKILEKSDNIEIKPTNTDPFDNYPKLTKQQFLEKTCLTREKRQDIITARKIHNWYMHYKDDVDELFNNGLRTIENHGIDFLYNINEIYDHFVEEQYYLNI